MGPRGLCLNPPPRSCGGWKILNGPNGACYHRFWHITTQILCEIAIKIHVLHWRKDMTIHSVAWMVVLPSSRCTYGWKMAKITQNWPNLAFCYLILFKIATRVHVLHCWKDMTMYCIALMAVLPSSMCMYGWKITQNTQICKCCWYFQRG